MELRYLKYFVAVAEELHFARAAGRLHIAQPSLSKQIQQLEQELDFPLFYRTKQRVEFFDAGHVFPDEARRILRQTENAVESARRTHTGQSGRMEEGQNDDWFTSVFIQRCFTLAVICIPLFIICELVSKTPVVNLRLLRIRNLGLASAVNFLLGASLYGSVFLLPEYLEQVQNYSARQTGEAMVLIGLPQLLIFPFVPRLMKRFDLRLIVFVGALI